MRATVSYVRSPDDVIEIRMSDGNCEFLSHINYTQLERVLHTRARLTTVQGDARRVGLLDLTLGSGSLVNAANYASLPRAREAQYASHDWHKQRAALADIARGTFS